MIITSVKCLKHSWMVIAIVLWGGSISYAQNISYEKRWYEVSRGKCVDGICGDFVPYEWLHVKYEDENTKIPKLGNSLFFAESDSAEKYMVKGYDIAFPFAVQSQEKYEVVDPISIYQLQHPQSWPTPLDEFFEVVVPFPEVFFAVDWYEVSLNSSPKDRRILRLKELFAEKIKFNQLLKCKRFVEIKRVLQNYGANIAPLREPAWKKSLAH